MRYNHNSHAGIILTESKIDFTHKLMRKLEMLSQTPKVLQNHKPRPPHKYINPSEMSKQICLRDAKWFLPQWSGKLIDDLGHKNFLLFYRKELFVLYQYC